MTFDPEAVLMQSGLEAASVAAFLHESMHAFINEQGAEGASVALEYLSSAGKPSGVIAHMRSRPGSSVMGCVWGEVHAWQQLPGCGLTLTHFRSASPLSH